MNLSKWLPQMASLQSDADYAEDHAYFTYTDGSYPPGVDYSPETVDMAEEEV